MKRTSDVLTSMATAAAPSGTGRLYNSIKDETLRVRYTDLRHVSGVIKTGTLGRDLFTALLSPEYCLHKRNTFYDEHFQNLRPPVNTASSFSIRSTV